MLVRLFVAALCALAVVPAVAQEVESISPELIGGTVADPADWPASPWVGNCSSTLIGPRTLITAAHCVSNGGTKSFTIGTSRYSGACTHHAKYRGNSTADWALCYLTSEVTGVPFEVVAKPAEVSCSVGKTFTWTGYGCQRWGGGIDGKFRVGTVNATKCPSGTNYDTVTRGSVALCSGDSGGGGYLVDAQGNRKLVGTNSRSDTRVTSYVSSTYSPAFYDWLVEWSNAKATKVCGVHADAPSCRGATPPDPTRCQDERDAVAAAKDLLTDAEEALRQCEAN
jgi:hypothetical protein